MKLLPFAVLSSTGLLSVSAHATPDAVEIIEVSSHPLKLHDDKTLAERLADAGLQFSAAGGVSALPVMNGMMGDRIQLLTDGAPITAACGNQMNPPLSYVSANQVHNISVFPGVSLVSEGGDNIAGVINISTFEPAFSDSSNFQVQEAELGYFFQSNDNARTLSASALVANDTWYIRYAGTRISADSYEDGRGNKIIDTLYKSTNHIINTGYQDDEQRLQLSLTYQSIPYQGFPNQYMDMTDNSSTGFTALYQRQFSNIALDSTLSLRRTTHEMGFFTPEKTGMMPMNTESEDLTLKLKWLLPASTQGQWVFGQEWYRNNLDDWWPAVENSMMMGPNDYVNINDGERERLAAFAEWSSAHESNWHLSAGARLEYVTTDTGDVQAYNDGNMMGMGSMGGMGGMTAMQSPDAEAAMMFNMADRGQSDTLIDGTIQAMRELESNGQLIFGLARKNRAPNLYERYTWGRGAMATSMIGWFGDGNGYVGDINLNPETAHTASITYSVLNGDWAAEISTWYSNVSDYIDVEVIGTFNRSGLTSGARNILQFSNTDAQLYGVSVKASRVLLDSTSGKLTLKNAFQWQQGERDDGGDLYQILPMQNTLSVEYVRDAFSSSVSWQWVSNKNDVDLRRFENSTDAYSVVDVNTAYTWQSFTLHFNITNLFDEYYQAPLGGVSVAEFRQDNTNGFNQIAGRGRSFDAGISYSF